MDSLTQLALGAAVGHLTIGRVAGRRGLVWGAVLGTLPDLDVLVPMGDAIADFTYHRSWSHSLLVLTVVSPLFGHLLARWQRRARLSVAAWTCMVWAVFVTHVLLDACTVYGTQLLWPAAAPPVSWGAIFVIDPLYTLPLLVGICVAWRVVARQPRRAWRANCWGIVLSSAYLALTFVAQSHVRDMVVRQWTYGQILAFEPERLIVAPMPFQALLWRVLVVEDDSYREGYVSLVTDLGKRIEFEDRPRFEGLNAARVLELDGAARLDWFSHGCWAASIEEDSLVVRDLRMGVEPDYFFRFVIAQRDEAGVWRQVPAQLAPARQSRLARLGWLWARIWDADA